MQRGQTVIRSNRCQSRSLFHRCADRTILMSGLVIVTKRNQRTDLQRQVVWPLSTITLLHFVLNYSAVLAVDHENRFLDLDPLDFVTEDRKRIQPKPRQIAKSLRMDHSRILVRRQLKRPPVNEKSLFQLGQQHDPADGRLHRRDQQAVIAPSIQSDDG